MDQLSLPCLGVRLPKYMRWAHTTPSSKASSAWPPWVSRCLHDLNPFSAVRRTERGLNVKSSYSGDKVVHRNKEGSSSCIVGLELTLTVNNIRIVSN